MNAYHLQFTIMVIKFQDKHLKTFFSCKKALFQVFKYRNSWMNVANGLLVQMRSSV